MIIDLPRFVKERQNQWLEFERLISALQKEPNKEMALEEVLRFHELFQKTTADLAQINTFSGERELRDYLEHLVSAGYVLLHSSRPQKRSFSFWQWLRFAASHFWRWLRFTAPQTFRAHGRAFYVACLIMLLGILMGAFMQFFIPKTKLILLPFPHIQEHPSERVKREESVTDDRLAERKATFSSSLITHNIRVALFSLAMGVTWGIGTLILLFYNGIIIGVISADYLMAGEGVFLAGWLLPHGSIEIPSILIAGQGGLLIAAALLGVGTRKTLRRRLAEIRPVLLTLIGLMSLLLCWAGIIESFFSQYHAPILPYWLKISFGAVQLGLLILYLARSGLGKKTRTMRS